MVRLDILYSFIDAPVVVNPIFLGIMDVTGKSIVFSLLAGATQFVQAHFMSIANPVKKTKERSFGSDFARTMQLQMKYVFPVIIAFIAYSLSALIAIYWTTSNLFTIGQELYLRRKFKREKET